MKCLSCKTTGTHFTHKICPQCTIDGVTRDDISMEKKSITFMGSDFSQEAGKHVTMLRKKHNISNVTYKAIKGDDSDMVVGMEVKWHQYELKDSGGSNGRKKDIQSK